VSNGVNSHSADRRERRRLAACALGALLLHGVGLAALAPLGWRSPPTAAGVVARTWEIHLLGTLKSTAPANAPQPRVRALPLHAFDTPTTAALPTSTEAGLREDSPVVLSNPDAAIPDGGVHGPVRLQVDAAGFVTDLSADALPAAYRSALRGAFINRQLMVKRGGLPLTAGTTVCLDVAFAADAPPRWRFAPC